MRFLFRSFVFLMLLVTTSWAQSPADGQIVGKAYVNSYFKLSYVWPEILVPADTSTLSLHWKSSANEFLLFSARQGTQPFGIVIIAEKLRSATERATGIKDGPDFLDRVIQSWQSSGGLKVLKRTHVVSPHGFVFDQLDYMAGGQYSSAVTTQVGQYLMAFKCNAKSAEDLSEMTSSILASSHIN